MGWTLSLIFIVLLGQYENCTWDGMACWAIWVVLPEMLWQLFHASGLGHARVLLLNLWDMCSNSFGFLCISFYPFDHWSDQNQPGWSTTAVEIKLWGWHQTLTCVINSWIQRAFHWLHTALWFDDHKYLIRASKVDSNCSSCMVLF